MNQQKTIRIMIVDDHLMVRDGLKVFLAMYDDLEVVGEAGDGQQAVALCDQLQPDVILMDIMMPNMDGPTATQRIRTEYPSIQVIALTSFADSDLVQQAIQSGAIGYVLKDTHADRLAEAIRDTHQGRASIDPVAAQALVQATQDSTRLVYDLTDREREILAMLVEGQTNKQIAEALTISLGTVRFHVSNILSKLGASNRTEAARLALEAGLVD